MSETDITPVEPLGTTDGGAPTYVNCWVCAGRIEANLAQNKITGTMGTRCADCRNANRR